MISILIYSLLIPLILYSVGVGVAAFMLPPKLQSYTLWIAPWIGIALISGLGIYASMATIPMHFAAYIIMIIGTILLSFAAKQKRLTLPTKTDALLGVLVLLTFLFSLYPLLTREQFATTISMGNLDPLSYTTVADFFITETIHDGKAYQPFSPYIWSIGDLVHHSYRWGTPMVLSFFSALFQVRSYVLFSILITLLFALSLPLVWILAKTLYPKIKTYLLLVVWSLYGINSTLLYMLYNVFFAQFMFGGLMILTLILGIELPKNNRPSTKILLAFLLCAVSHIYPEGLLFVLLPCFLFGRWKILLLATLFNPYTMYQGVWQLVQVAMRTANLTWIGWEPIRYATLMEILGLYNLHYSRPLPMVLTLITGLGILFVLMVGFWKSRARLFLLTNLSVFMLIYFSTRYLGHNYYTYHRALTYTLFLYVVLFTIGAGVILARLRRSYLAVLLVIGIILLSTRSAVRTLQQFYWHHQSVDLALISLERLPPQTQPFFTDDMIIGERHLWRRLWQEYMLRDQKIVSRQNYPTDHALTGKISLVLSARDTVRENADRLDYQTIVWENNAYVLGTLYQLTIDPEIKVKP